MKSKLMSYVFYILGKNSYRYKSQWMEEVLVSDQHSDCLLVAEDGVRLVLLLMSQYAMNRKSTKSRYHR